MSQISTTPPDPPQLIPPGDCAAGLYCHALFGGYLLYVPILSVSSDRKSVVVMQQGVRVTMPISTVLDLANGPPPFAAPTPNSFTLPLT